MKEPSRPSLLALFDILAIACWVGAVFIFEHHEMASLLMVAMGFLALTRKDLLSVKYETEKTLYHHLGTKRCPKCKKGKLEFQVHCTKCHRSTVFDPFEKEVNSEKNS